MFLSLMSIKNIFSFAASIIKLFIVFFLLITNSNAEENNIKQYSSDEGVLSIMYHMFEENKALDKTWYLVTHACVLFSWKQIEWLENPHIKSMIKMHYFPSFVFNYH